MTWLVQLSASAGKRLIQESEKEQKSSNDENRHTTEHENTSGNLEDEAQYYPTYDQQYNNQQDIH